jgi:predicted secreted protein
MLSDTNAKFYNLPEYLTVDRVILLFKGVVIFKHISMCVRNQVYYKKHFDMKGGVEVMPPVFFHRNVFVITMKFTCMIHTLFYKVSIFFNTLLSILIKTLYTSVVNFPVSISENIIKNLFQFVAICKMAFT